MQTQLLNDQIFFQRPKPINLAPVNVGTNNGVFLAIAVALVDNLTAMNMPADEALFKILLGKYFSSLSTMDLSKLPYRQMQSTSSVLAHMINSYGMLYVLQSLAFILKQIAVDEICQNSAYYCATFCQDSTQLTPTCRRAKDISLNHTSAIPAIANKLDLTIEINMVEPEKELPMRICYNKRNTEHASSIKLLKDKQHYFALVRQPMKFVNLQDPSELKLIADNHDPKLSAMLIKINKKNKILAISFENLVEQLTNLVSTNKIERDTLVNIYTDVYSVKNYGNLSKSINSFGLNECGSQSFFNNVMQPKLRFQALNEPSSYSTHLIKHLIFAIARAICLGQLNEEEVMSKIKQKFQTATLGENLGR